MNEKILCLILIISTTFIPQEAEAVHVYCNFAPPYNPLHCHTDITYYEYIDEDYVGVFAEMLIEGDNPPAGNPAWSVVEKGFPGYTHWWQVSSCGPGWLSYGTSFMVTEWSGQPQGAFVRAAETEDVDMGNCWES